MPDGDRHDVSPERAPLRWVAAMVALGLGALAAVLMVAGHPPWEGRVLFGITGSHGIHEGDAFALAPLLAGAGLAWWCATR